MGTTHTQRKKAWSLALSPLFWFLRAARPSTVRAADARSAGSLLSCIDTKYMMFSLLLHIFLCSTSCAGLLIGVLLAQFIVDLAMSEGLVGLCMCTGTYHAKDGKNSGGPLLQDNQTTTGANARLLCVVWSRCARCQHQQHQNDNQHQNRLPLQQNVASPHTKHTTRKSKSNHFFSTNKNKPLPESNL